ncbi:MAG TPA: hypothetical protein VFI82_01510 [Terriglobales bacterium]|jgi:hypothetical protein|nr:hypothetical protein [Terriglobales bacterium]
MTAGVLLHAPALLAPARQFGQVRAPVDAAAAYGEKIRQRRVMAIAAPLQLANQLLVPPRYIVRLKQILLEVPAQVEAAPETGDEHVQFDVFSEQVLAAHEAGVDHPHAHQPPACFKARAPMSVR